MRGILAKKKRKIVADSKPSNIECVIDLDTTHASNAIDAMKRYLIDGLSAEETALNKLNDKMPHIRIDIDNINEVPKVYIDGVDVTDDKNNHTVLQRLNVDWNTSTTEETPKSYDIQLYDIKNHCKRGYAQSNCIERKDRVITLKYPKGTRRVRKNLNGEFVDVFSYELVSSEEVKRYAKS